MEDINEQISKLWDTASQQAETNVTFSKHLKELGDNNASSSKNLRSVLRFLECLTLDYANVVGKLEGTSPDEVTNRVKSCFDSLNDKEETVLKIVT